jgi:reverse gyrase
MKYSSNSKGIIHPSFDFKWKDLITIQLQQNHLSESESEEVEVVVVVEEEEVNHELPPYPPFNNNNNSSSSNDQLELLSNQSNQVLLYLQMNLQQGTTSSTVNSDVIRLYEETVVALNECQKVLQGTSNSIILLIIVYRIR